MKALSLKQPWAELVVSGLKKIEIRKWNTKFRGDFLIHASKVPDNVAMERFGFKDLPFGRIVGKAKLINVKKYIDKDEFVKDKWLHLATSDFENYGFILEDVKMVKEIKCKGALGFWEFKK
jgi:hypothetical protein